MALRQQQTANEIRADLVLLVFILEFSRFCRIKELTFWQTRK